MHTRLGLIARVKKINPTAEGSKNVENVYLRRQNGLTERERPCRSGAITQEMRSKRNFQFTDNGGLPDFKIKMKKWAIATLLGIFQLVQHPFFLSSAKTVIFIHPPAIDFSKGDWE